MSGPTSANTEQQITITNRVKNQGLVAAAGFTVRLYLSSDAVITSADIAVGERYIASLAAGVANAADLTVTVPASIASGTYYIGAIADANNDVTESDETNNALAGNQITVTIGPDLTMSAVSGPSTGLTGGQITVSNTVTTTGGASGFYVSLYLSADNVISSSDVFLGCRYVTSLAPNASDTAGTTVTIPNTTVGGTYYLGAVADACGTNNLNFVAESNETNNTLAGNQITVGLVTINPVTSPTNQSSQTITGSMVSGATVAVSVNTAATVGPVTYPTSTTWSCTISGLVAGANAITVTATDSTGNFTTATSSITYYILAISNVGVSSNTIDTSASQTATIFFTLNGPATATLKIIPETLGPTGTPVYQATQIISSAGAQMFTWDGKNSVGNVVADEAYLYVIEATDGVTTVTYSPAPPTGTGTVTCSKDSYDPFKNDPMTVSYSLTQPGRVKIDITWESQTFTVVSSLARATGSYTFDWDGRNPTTGKILPDGANVTAVCTETSLFRENHIITTGNTPKITGIKTDPYEMQLSYGEFTRIKYTLSRVANVTVTVVSPSGTSITLVNNQPQTAGTQEVEWKALDASDTTAKKFLVSQEGIYTVSIQAVNPATGTSSTTKGVLQIRQ